MLIPVTQMHGFSFAGFSLLICTMGQKGLPQALFGKRLVQTPKGICMFPSMLDLGLSVEDRGYLVLTTGS